MNKFIKQVTSLFAVIAVLFAFAGEAMAAKKSKTLKKHAKKRFRKMWCFSRSSWIF